MEARKQNRNAIRSKQMIRQAYLALLVEKPYEKITATDIIHRADINRSTFYAHYPDVRGIMDEVTGEILQMFRTMLNSIDFSTFFDDPMPILSEVVDFLQRNEDMYRLLIRSSMASEQLEQLKKVLITQVINAPNLPVRDRTSVATAIRVRMLLGGLIDTYRQWLEGEFTCSFEEAAAEVAKFIRIMGSDTLYRS